MTEKIDHPQKNHTKKQPPTTNKNNPNPPTNQPTPPNPTTKSLRGGCVGKKGGQGGRFVRTERKRSQLREIWSNWEPQAPSEEADKGRGIEDGKVKKYRTREKEFCKDRAQRGDRLLKEINSRLRKKEGEINRVTCRSEGKAREYRKW